MVCSWKDPCLWRLVGKPEPPDLQLIANTVIALRNPRPCISLNHGNRCNVKQH